MEYRTFCAYLGGSVCALLFAIPAQAALFVQELDYRASESMWGNQGNTLSFNASGSASVGVVDIISYDIGFDSGTVTAKHSGALQADYQATVAAPGTTTIALDWLPDASRGLFGFNGGRLQTDLGVYANVTALSVFDILDEDYSTNINVRHRPDIPDSVSGSDSASGVSGSVAIPLIAEAGAEVRPTQTSSLDISSLSGQLAYTQRGSGVTNFMPFTLGAGGLDLDFDLTDGGFWDFMLVSDPILNNLYTATFGLDLVIFEEHLTFTGRVRNEKNLGTLVSWAGDSFGLSFDNLNELGSFSIFVEEVVDNVAVPEPGSLALMMIGLLSLISTRRRLR